MKVWTPFSKLCALFTCAVLDQTNKLLTIFLMYNVVRLTFSKNWL